MIFFFFFDADLFMIFYDYAHFNFKFLDCRVALLLAMTVSQHLSLI